MCGFSCKDFSSLNKAKKKCITSGNGTSSQTFLYTIGFLCAHRPAAFILENVPQVLGVELNMLGLGSYPRQVMPIKSDMRCFDMAGIARHIGSLGFQPP